MNLSAIFLCDSWDIYDMNTRWNVHYTPASDKKLTLCTLGLGEDTARWYLAWIHDTKLDNAIHWWIWAKDIISAFKVTNKRYPLIWTDLDIYMWKDWVFKCINTLVPKITQEDDQN